MKKEHAMALLKLINDVIPDDYNLSDIQAYAIAELTKSIKIES